jgi:hypothetical protein
MPAPRSNLTAALGSNNAVYLFGGEGPDGLATGTLWRFDTTSPPSGVYLEIGDTVELARAGAAAVQLGTERFVVTGAPPLDLSLNRIAASGGPPLDANGAAVVAEGVPFALFAGSPIVRLTDTEFDTLQHSAEPGATAAALPDSRIVFAGGSTADLLVIDAATGTAATLAGALTTPRDHPAVAATARHLVVAGGSDPAGNPIPTADIYDAVTLGYLGTIPCTARTGARAFAFLNDQIAIVGGSPENDQIELFTPGP